MRAANIINNLISDVWEVPSLNCYGDLYNLVEAPENVTVGWGYVDNKFIAPTPIPEQIQAENKQRASTLLLETDWVELPSVSDINNIPYLLNKAEFIDYRIALRVIVVNPINAVFPVKPTSEWFK